LSGADGSEIERLDEAGCRCASVTFDQAHPRGAGKAVAHSGGEYRQGIRSRGRLRPQPASDGCDPSRRRGHHGQHLPAGGAVMMIMPYFRDPPGHRARNLCSGEVASKHFKV